MFKEVMVETYFLHLEMKTAQMFSYQGRGTFALATFTELLLCTWYTGGHNSFISLLIFIK